MNIRNQQMMINEIEQQLSAIEEAIPKIKDILNDLKLCTSDTTKQILMAAIKKYANPIIDFKI